VRARRAECSRRRGGESAAVAPKAKGEMDGEHEGVAGELTAARFGAEDGRERELDVGGEARGGQRWRTAVCSSISAGVWLGRARRRAEEVEGEVRRLGARGIEAR
jgi:hypothetical protein